METSVQDIPLDKYPGRRTKSKLFSVVDRTLLRYQVGTFCFPFFEEFGCGSQHSVNEGKTLAVEAGFDAAGVKLGASYTYAVQTTWTHTSGRCEWCKPTICLREASLETWDCLNTFTGNSWEEGIFRPGASQPRISPNCSFDPSECGCSSETDEPTSGRGGVLLSQAGSHETVALAPHGLRPTRAPAASKVDPWASTAEYLDALAEPDWQSEAPRSLVVTKPGRDPAVITPSDPARPGLALLSTESGPSGERMRALPDGRIPILAIASHTPQAAVTMKLQVRNGDEIRVVDEDLKETRGERVTTVQGEMTMPPDVQKGAADARVVVELRDPAGQTMARDSVPVHGM